MAPLFCCAPGMVHLLGGVSPLHTRQGEVLAGRNLPMAAGGASSGTARREYCCRGAENLMEALVERENMLNA